MELPFTDAGYSNVLPFDGEAVYHGRVVEQEEADEALVELGTTIEWRNECVKMFGREIMLARKVALYGELPFTYRYSGITHYALPWTAALVRLKLHVEGVTGCEFNSCLLNLYHDGSEYMGWHSDNEPELLKNAPIASLSLGASRKFDFRHKQTKTTCSLRLEHGSLLVMDGAVQQHWLHRLPKEKSAASHRINLTFRVMEPARLGSLT